MKTYSLRRASLTNFIIPLILTILITLGAALWSAQREISRLYDAQMMQMANTLLVLTQHEAIEGEDINATLGDKAAQFQALHNSMIAYRIWADDSLVTQSQNAQNLGEKTKSAGFSMRTVQGQQWRMHTLFAPNTPTAIEIAQLYSVRTGLVWQILRSLTLPFLLFLPCVVVVVMFGIRRLLAPIEELSSALDSRDANDLTPLQPRLIPQEITPLFAALNALFLRLSDSIQRERDFTDNAAHELRTPLAALKTRAQVFTKQIKDNPPLKEGMDDLMATINRAVGVVDQLLSFTRLQTDGLALTPIDLSEIVRSMLTDIAPQAVAKNQTLEADIEDNITVTGHAGALGILARNLIDNAILYTPHEEEIRVTLEKQGDKILFRVSDTGQGIKPEDRERVFERFTRLDTEQNGSGLGLSIVKWICNEHAANITLDGNTPNGLIITITFKG